MNSDAESEAASDERTPEALLPVLISIRAFIALPSVTIPRAAENDKASPISSAAGGEKAMIAATETKSEVGGSLFLIAASPI